jgi:ankyrin repeat protein
VDAKDNNSWTPLHWAASWNRKEVAELLLAKGADVNAKTKDDRGSTPLNLAQTDDMKVLLRKHGAK